MDESKLEMLDDMNGIVEGEMIIPLSKANDNLGSPDFNTLDEPIRETILRDLRAVGNKFAHVLIPTEKKTLLKEFRSRSRKNRRKLYLLYTTNTGHFLYTYLKRLPLK